MNPIRVVRSALACAVAAGVPTVSLAQGELITFSFSDLNASFINGTTPATRVFTAQAVANTQLATGGDVSRVDVSPPQTATFLSGFRAISTADIVVQMNVGLVSGPTVAATGLFAITDADDDIITGTIAGTWTDLGAGFDSFQGLILSASITPIGGGDNLHFNGPGSGGQFAYAGLPMTSLNGALVQLQLTPGVFFNASFDGVSSQVSGILVPGPGVGALMLAGLAAGIRRRRT